MRAWGDSGAFLVFLNMSLCHSDVMRVVASFGLMLVLASPAFGEDAVAPAAKQSPAEIRSVQLDKLFGRLHQANSPQDPTQIEQDIRTLWARNDSPTARATSANASV